MTSPETSPETSARPVDGGHTAVLTPVLTLDDVHVRYGGSHVLQGVTFEVPATGVTALLGRNGVGKTTTLKAVLGLAPRTGSIAVRGNPIETQATTRIVRDGIGYVPEDREVFAGLTVDENLRLVDPERGIEAPIVRDLFPDLIARRAQRAGTLSGGQQQMVSLARVLLRDNTVLLIDEPTKGLAPKLVTEVADVLAEVARMTPILLVEQNLALVRRIADTVVVLDAGRVVHRGRADALVADAELTRGLLGVSMRREGAA
ncbi:branched-chain amino acid ABC transporter ATPase [Intrasporangium oryzae NRRL B-24470]|uniref:Branched-chain amino acid ABC transporter ATPase n=1 Tax=Intrasporangium oryzae NRRL B-24470 TaxID=1386089 RepID=W9GAN3_9MICO|nr:ABC transporter ATP-binding protein [Intrasporangium oryzae]EWT01893.1 branched-chain amino acid ABC transporter ATPase [Intrasporangium oryzae NRRL B-24470]